MMEIDGSSNIEAIGHDNGTLSVRFKGGGEYNYEKVPSDLHQRFMEADSKGSFFHNHIRGKFEAKKKER